MYMYILSRVWHCICSVSGFHSRGYSVHDCHRVSWDVLGWGMGIGCQEGASTVVPGEPHTLVYIHVAIGGGNARYVTLSSYTVYTTGTCTIAKPGDFSDHEGEQSRFILPRTHELVILHTSVAMKITTELVLLPVRHKRCSL